MQISCALICPDRSISPEFDQIILPRVPRTEISAGQFDMSCARLSGSRKA
ncbi:hypothetical protein RBY4I_2039 [Rhodobacterales bacterium Y4I]|nr:hypothetical protein RBY4I_2039 [Rhodobacterales bacterium Y4I]